MNPDPLPDLLTILPDIRTRLLMYCTVLVTQNHALVNTLMY